MDEQTLKAAVSVLFHGGKDLPVTELGLAQLRSVDLALMDGASPAEAMRAAEKSTSAEPEAPAASLASEARDAKAARTELDSQSEIKMPRHARKRQMAPCDKAVSWAERRTPMTPDGKTFDPETVTDKQLVLISTNRPSTVA